MRIHWKLAGISLLVLPLAMVSCTGTEVIQPGNGQLTIDLLVVPPVGPPEPYLYARAEVSAVTFKAADSNWQISLGPFPLQVNGQSTETDLRITSEQTLGTVTITSGRYKLYKVFINKFMLNTSNSPPVSNDPRCNTNTDDGVVVTAEFSMEGTGDSGGIVPSTQPDFEIRNGEPRALKLTLDGPALVSLLKQHVVCVESFCPPGSSTKKPVCVTPIPPEQVTPLLTVQVN